jgi:hypothetical protein
MSAGSMKNLHPQIAVDRALTLGFGEAAHGIEVVGFEAVEVVLGLRVNHSEDRVGVRPATHVRNSPVIARDGDVGACFCQRSTSGLCEVAALDVQAADRSNRPRTSFFMKLDFDMGSGVPGSRFACTNPEHGTRNPGTQTIASLRFMASKIDAASAADSGTNQGALLAAGNRTPRCTGTRGSRR